MVVSHLQRAVGLGLSVPTSNERFISGYPLVVFDAAFVLGAVSHAISRAASPSDHR